MRAVIQRVKKTTLSVDGELISEIPFGLAVYLASQRFVRADIHRYPKGDR